MQSCICEMQGRECLNASNSLPLLVIDLKKKVTLKFYMKHIRIKFTCIKQILY